MLGIIYKITLDNLIYYGSCRDFEKRIKLHLKRTKSNSHSYLKLYRSMKESLIKKYEIVETIDEINDIDLCKKEQEYIDKYDTINSGLNTIRSYLSKENDLADRRKATEKYKEKNYIKCLECVRDTNKKNKDSGKFSCELCNYNFSSNRDLNRHLSSKRHKIKLDSI